MSATMLATLLPAAKEKAGQTVDKLNGFLKGLVKNAPTIALIAAAVPKIMDFMKGALEPFEAVSEAMTELGYTASTGFQDMADGIAEAVYNLQPVAEDMAMWFSDLYTDVTERDWDGLRQGVGDGLTRAWEAIVGFFGDTQRMEDIGNFAGSIVNGIGDWLNNMSTSDWTIIFDGITTAMTTFFENVDWEKVFAGIWNAFVSLGEAIALKFKNILGQMADDISDEENPVDWYGGPG